MEVKAVILTGSKYWYRRYIKARGLSEKEAKHVDDSYQMQGLPRSVEAIITNGSNRLAVYTINRARERFDVVRRDYLDS